MEIVQNAFDCADCRRFLEKPVTLVCGTTVCLKHVESLKDGNFFCKSCERDHPIEKRSLSVNKSFELLINANIKNIYFGHEYKEALGSFNKLNEMIAQLETIAKDPSYFINKSIGQLKNKTELIREHHKLVIDLRANQIIRQLDEYEKNCRANLNSFDFKAKVAKLDKHVNEVKLKLNKWKIILNDFGSIDYEWRTIVRESKQILSNLAGYLIDFEYELLLNDKIDLHYSTVFKYQNVSLKSSQE